MVLSFWVTSALRKRSSPSVSTPAEGRAAAKSRCRKLVCKSSRWPWLVLLITTFCLTDDLLLLLR